ncbi:hypothetical protein C8R44DRAFT_800910 [Mycena epipterygia]|nr:hypothetical protein C8R44DRAFT_800910 [Mycena epipterygia]
MPPQATIMRVYIILGLLCYVLSHPLHQRELHRGLAGLLGDGDDDPLIPSDSEMDTQLPQPPPLTIISSEDIGGLFTVGRDSNTASSRIQVTGVSSASRTSSTLGSGAESTQSIAATASSTTSTSSPSPTVEIGVTKEAPSTPPAEAAEWKVIGIAAVSIGLVAGIMLSIVFFDSWWGFMRALVGKKRKERGTEDMVPDWARRDWEFKIASEDGHRYPTLASLESMTKPKLDPISTAASPLMCISSNPHHLVPTRPPSLYFPVVDPHPLEPLFRRPSASNHPVYRA